MNLQDVFNLGTEVQYLRLIDQFKGLPPVQGKNWLINTLNDISSFLEKENFPEIIRQEVSNSTKELNKKYPSTELKIKQGDADSLSKKAERWMREMRRELGTVRIVRVELQSGLNPDELRKIAEQLPSEFIASDIWEKLTEIEKSDFSDAARCLLLGTATPSVMVALRGAEASIRNYYRCKTQEEPRSKTWRQLTNELKDKATDLNIKDTFIGYLDYIGDAKRNFAQHPNKIYTLREAVMIFMQVVALVEDVYIQI